MPFNFRFLGLVRTILPQTKIIHCRRSPEATCVSISKQLFNDPQGFAYDLAELGCYYVDYKRLMEHWQSLMPNWIMDLHYEDIIVDQEGETRRLLEFCNLSWDETCLDFHKSDRTIGTASNLQVRRPLYRSSVESWKRHEKHLGPSLNALKL